MVPSTTIHVMFGDGIPDQQLVTPVKVASPFFVVGIGETNPVVVNGGRFATPLVV
jgi:hypothetical protein